MKLAVTTGSSNANVFELMGAKGALDLVSAYENGFGFGLKGAMDGIADWKGSLELQKPIELVRVIREPLSLFLARAFLSDSFVSESSVSESSESSREVRKEQEKQLLMLLFSDELFNKVLAALEAVVRQVDQTPESRDDLRIEIAGSASDVRVNGKTIKEFTETLEGTVKAEGERLMAELEPQFAFMKPMPSAPEQTP